jgi:hypothetical protein
MSSFIPVIFNFEHVKDFKCYYSYSWKFAENHVLLVHAKFYAWSGR